MTWAAVWTLAKRLWWAAPMIALAIALYVTRATLADRTTTLKNERSAWNTTLARADLDKANAEKRFASAQTSALTTYADRLASREPIILRSTDTVRTYAQTDAGRAACLAADRVHGIDALDAELFADHPGSAGGSEEAVPGNAVAPAG